MQVKQSGVAAMLGIAVLLAGVPGRATVSQINGQVVPYQTSPTCTACDQCLQRALDKGETGIDAVRDASTQPQTYLVPQDTNGKYGKVSFTYLQHGAGYYNSFGWYNVGSVDPDASKYTTPGFPDSQKLYRVLACNACAGDMCCTGVGPVVIDFEREFTRGRYLGGFIAFYLLTPDGGTPNCGDHVNIPGASLDGGGDVPTPGSAYYGQVYLTESALNNDGEYVHYLVYTSPSQPLSTFYFGFEDLYRGGDNDFDDSTFKVEGLERPCIPVPETCDGKDNNCNGLVDEGDPGGGGACDTGQFGVCKPGTLHCTGGALACQRNVGPSGEVCDGLDNNCDGQADEGDPGGGVACDTGQPGICRAGTTHCVGGAIVCVQNSSSSAELCDGLDNDCNGQVDDGLGTITCGLGVCRHTVDACVGGVPQTCDPFQGQLPEVCDGLDNNCNGQVDENDPGSGASCQTGEQGVCASGTIHCVGGVLTCVRNIDPGPEICDGKDNDCNGVVDDGLGTTTCGLGVCRHTAANCAGGVPQACDPMAGASPERCDGLDNNCDGQVDEGDPEGGGACDTGQPGVCRDGVLRCQGGTLHCVATRQPGPEICDGLDNDCNGLVDDGLGTTACGLGVCRHTVLNCVGGAPQACDPMAGATPEVCDGIDNNCNGQVDEGDPGGGAACDTGLPGICKVGTVHCVNGHLACVPNQNPVPEVCDGLDNDCNGVVDDIPEAGTVCALAVGVCSPGVWVCENGVLECRRDIGPTPEICDGLDNDCDGVVDDGDPGGGTPCGSSVGECRPGVEHCRNGVIVCEGGIGPKAEVCDCLDNDCNGATDDGELCPPGSACINCACAVRCDAHEFGCPPGTRCVGEYCLPDPCYQVTCAAGSACQEGQCVDLCSAANCAPDETCVGGLCLKDACYIIGCPAGEICRDGKCGPDPCAGVTCGPREFCRDGTCVTACEQGQCQPGDLCRDGICVADPCAGVACFAGKRCVDGTCQDDPCATMTCGAGRVCRDGACTDDPCLGVTCPLGATCRDGQCELSRQPAITAVGGACAAAPGAGRASALALLGLALLGGCLARRRPLRAARPARRPRGALLLLALAATATMVLGCQVREYLLPLTGDGGSTIDGAPPPDGSADDGAACIPTGVEVCDGLDNDCNGVIDDGFDLLTDPRNCGTCGHSCDLPGSYTRCQAGECVFLTCVPGHLNLDGTPELTGCPYACVPAGEELCDGVDNNCDGQIDEGFDLQTDPANCGTCGNVCVFANATSKCQAATCRIDHCADGFYDRDGDPANGCEYACVLTNGGVEACDGRDNNCDGQVDEGFDLQTDPANCGACGRFCRYPHAAGLCVTGQCEMGACDAGWVDLDHTSANGCEYGCVMTNGGVEICDGLDNDCNGQVDESDPRVGQACNTGQVGACAAGTFACVGGGLICVRTAAPSPEVCDGKDNDCNGQTDEGLGSSPCGKGACFRMIPNCVGGVPQSCDPMVGATAEACDGIDNNCDGQVDEGNPGGGVACDTGLKGACAFGVTACIGGNIVCRQVTYPTAETCNGVDDDCDGVIDNGLGSTTCGLGGCRHTVPNCVGGVPQTCDPFQGRTTEACDGIDNNCDGQVDEGDPGGGGACNTGKSGVCAAGIRHCIAGVLTCVQTTFPSAEVCDGLDNDCSGQVDDGLGSTTCGLGECHHTVSNCLGGVPQTCDPMAGAGSETCDGKDNNCNGQTDEGDPGGGSACSTGQPGICGPGVTHCVGGVPQCVANQTAVPEICGDGLDNNCNGQADENCLHLGPGERRLDSTDTGTPHTNSLEVDLAAVPTNGDGGAGTGPDRVLATWADRRSGSRTDIYFTRSVDGGTTFAADARINGAVDYNAVNPHLATDGTDRVYIAYEAFENGAAPGTTRNVRFLLSTDGGASFGAPIGPLDAAVAGNDVFNLDIAADPAGLVAVVWEELRPPTAGNPADRGARSIHLSVSVNGGASFLGDLLVDHGQGFAGQPRVAIAGGRVYVVWRDRRTNAGSTSTGIYLNYTDCVGSCTAVQAADVRVDTEGAATATNDHPSLAVRGNDLYVAWEHTTPRAPVATVDIRYDRSTSRGTGGWLAGGDILLDQGAFQGDSLRPTVLLAPSGAVIVGWQDYRDGLPQVLVARSTDGATFASPVRADTPSAGGSYDPRVAMAGPRVVVVYASTRSGVRKDIYANYSVDEGVSFQAADIRLDTGSGLGVADSFQPRVATTTTRAHCAWIDLRQTPFTFGDVYYNAIVP